MSPKITLTNKKEEIQIIIEMIIIHYIELKGDNINSSNSC